MYLKDLEHRITLRLNQEQFDFLCQMTDMTGMKPSEYIRMMLNTQSYAFKKANSIIDDAKNEDLRKVVGLSNENNKADKHDFV